ncbi:MAG: AsmA family protein [Desulfobacterales bacterium]|nr:MAG: AsmA family protein [Desulfobacterales bacterium]
MRWKWIAGTVFFLIIALMASIYVFLYTYDYNKLKPRIARMVRDATGRELNIGGEINLVIGLSPALVVTDITFANASWGSQPHMVRMDKLQAHVRLLPLLTRDVELKKIALAGGAVLLETKPDGQGNWEFPADESPVKSTGPSKAAKINADNIRFENVDLTYRDGKTGAVTHFSLADLKVAEQAAGDRLAVDLKADYNGQPLTLAGQTGLVRALSGSERFPFELSGAFADAAVKLEGAVDDVLKLEGIDLKVQTSGKNLAKLKLARNIKLPKTTAFDLTGHVRGSKDSLALNDLSGNLSASDVNLAFSGNVGDLMAINGIDLQLKGSGKDLAEIGVIIDRKLPATDEFAVQGRLTGSADALSLQAANGSARRGGISIVLSGGIKDLLNLSGADLNVKGSGKNLSELGAIIDEKLPATDEFTVEGRLTGSAKTLSLLAARGSAKRGRLKVAVNGEVKDLIAFSGVDLVAKGSGRDLAEVDAIIDRKLPATDEFAFEGRLSGSTKALSLKNAQATARRGRLHLNLSGAVKNLLTLRGLDLHIQGSGKNLAEIGPLTGKKLPPTDQFFLEGRLTGSGRELSLHDVHGEARRGSLSLTVAGAIGDLVSFGRVNLLLKGTGKDLAHAEAIVGQKLPPTDAFALQGRLTGSAGSFSLQEARGRARRGSLKLEATGAIKDMTALTGMDLRLKAGGKEFAEIGPLVGTILPDLGPFEFSGHFNGSARSFSLGDLTAVVDQSDFNGRAIVEVRQRPKITIVLESSLLDITALMKNLEKEEKEAGSVPSGLESRLFSNDPLPLDLLKQVDADVSLNAKNVRARDANFEFGRLILTLENGDLDIDTLQATYKQTRISGNFHLYPESPPRIAAKFLVQDFDLGGLLRELRISEEVRSQLDIAVDVDSKGGSMHTLMARLNGSVGAVMGEGYLTRYLDLLSVGLSRKVIHFWGSHKKGGEIRCAIVQFDVSNGIATSRAFVFDTEAGVLTGEGDINLATEQVKFLLVPEPRYPSLMNFWTKLRVSGTIMDPKVRPDTLSLLSKGARALSALAIGPLGLLAPFVNLGANKAHPCNVHGIGK